VRLVVEARDESLNPVGLLARRSLDIVARFCDVDTWSMTIRADDLPDDLRPAFDEGGGIRVIDMDSPDLRVVTSGPWVGNDEDWTPDARGLITLSGVGDDTHLAERVVLPRPGQPITTAGQAGTAYDVRTGPAEDVIKAYVSANVAGAGALPGRGQPFYQVSPSQGRGKTVTGSGRYGTTVLELAQQLAFAGGDMGFRTLQSGTALVFDMYQPVTRDLVLLSRQGGTLRGGKTTRKAPTATHAIILQQGEGADRFVSEFTTAESLRQSQSFHRRIEVVIDRRDTDDEATARQSAAQALAKGTAQGTIVADVQDIDDVPAQGEAPSRKGVKYGRDYYLGDRVFYAPWWLPRSTPPLVDIVREVHIAAGEDGPPKVQAAVGPPGTTTDPPGGQYARIRALESQVAALRAQ